jgi:tetratricopeptide (TPR) repeat protein
MPPPGRGGGERARHRSQAPARQRPAARRRLALAACAAAAGLLLLAACRAQRPQEGAALSLYMQARIAREMGETGKAALLLERAAALEPAQPRIFAALGDARLALGDDGGAREALRRAVLLDPDDVPAHLLLARLDVRDRRPRDALARLVELDERLPAREEVLELAHPLLLWAGEVERGRELFERAVACAPDLALAHEALGDFLACLGRHEAALSSYRRALALDPTRRAAELKAAHLLEKQVESLLRRLPAPAPPGLDLPPAPGAAPTAR